MSNIELKDWWQNLNSEWKSIFFKALNIEVKPTDREIEEMVTLKEINCSMHNIDDLEPLRYMADLELIICFKTNISSLEPISNLKKLREIRFFETNISSLEPLKNMQKLEKLSCNNTLIESILPITNLKNFQVVDIRDTNVTREEITEFKKNHPDCILFFS